VRVGGQAIVDPRAAALTRDEAGLSQDAQMVRNRGLVQREAGREIADADLILGSRERGEDRQPVRIGKGLEQGRT
jgi:hypothetical protein